MEYKQFQGLNAEIIIETLFHRAWQEVSHIRPDKASLSIPTSLKPSTGRALAGELNNIIDEFEELLGKNGVHEREVHKYLHKNKFILHPNPKEILSEVPIGLGTESRIDFLIREADGSYILIEIENPNLIIFNKNGDFSHKANHAQRQVEDWQEWIENNLSTVQKKYPEMTSPKGLVIMGRSKKFTDSERLRLSRRNKNLRGSLLIMTYDELILNARAYITSIKNHLQR